MTNEQLTQIHAQIYAQVGRKIDLYHSEQHRGILCVLAGEPLTPFNVVFRMNY